MRSANKGWWSRSGSNRRPQACKARALPTELRPRSRKAAWRQPPDLSAVALAKAEACGRFARLRRTGFGVATPAASQRRLVGPGGVEPPTSRLSGVRSNHLSYEPLFRCQSDQTPDRFATQVALRHRTSQTLCQYSDIRHLTSDIWFSGKGDVDGGEAMP